ncbi:imm11 family protein [Lysinibacillus agricola]|uniref:imm11 family protein n=1 Tax=Lysinibacillus agricola TaxID=2590012 RepID=UPI003C136947
MKVYRFGNDYDFKELTFLNEKEDVNLFASFTGQKITLDWNEEVFGISEGKLNRGKLLDFDSRCYGATFIVKKKFEKLFIEEFSDIIETFPIKIKGISEEYIYINLTNVVTAINFDGLDMQESLAMLRGENIRFNLEKIENETLFRDIKINCFYFCTQNFKDFIEKNRINGLKFKEVGTAT